AAPQRRRRVRPGAVGRHRRNGPGTAPRPAGPHLGRTGAGPMTVDVVVHADPAVLAEAVAARLLVRLVDAQAERGEATVVLTGGGIATDIYHAVAASPARHAVDWARVTLWWGD